MPDPRPDTRNDHQQRILNVLVHIQDHLDEALSLEALADIACFSPFHFHRVFRGMVGESVMEHIRRLRLERAAVRLVHSETPVTRIAFDAGYESLEGFSRKFHDMFGVAPSQFRAQRRFEFRAVPSDVHYDETARPTRFKRYQFAGGKLMNVEIKTFPRLRVAFIRHVGPYMDMAQTWNKLMQWAGPKGVFGPATRCMGLYYDDPEITPPEKLRSDACVTVPPHITAEGDVGIQEIGGGEYAVTRHIGPYDQLPGVYARLCGEWFPDSGRQYRSSPAIEEYLNNPQTTPPEKLMTDIYMAIE